MQELLTPPRRQVDAGPFDQIRMVLRSLTWVLALLGTITLVHTQVPEFQSQILWQADTDGYHTYRIPVLLATPRGTLLAFSEARADGASDAGNIDLVFKRSIDNGRTWSSMNVICDDGPHTCGNPAPVVDQETGVIHLLLTHNFGSDDERSIILGTSQDVRRVWYTQSIDDGLTWATPRDISATLREANWRWYATGPVHGIQLTQGLHKGRLVIPANHSVASVESNATNYRSHVLFSDDGGYHWQLGGTHGPYTNESTVVELSDGTLMLNMRSYHGEQRRAVVTSGDGGVTWSAVSLDSTLIEPTCQASLLRYRWPTSNYPQGILLFSNPASTTRDHMTIRASFDDGTSWPTQRLIERGSSAYSSLARLPNDDIGLLYERANYQEIIFASFSLDWVLNN
tara:strand:- start:384 stop:1580 length:1197 start_codon:yes stop_codon:yes gene_type:complete